MSSASLILIGVLSAIGIGLVAVVFIVLYRKNNKEEQIVRDGYDRDDKYKAIINIKGSRIKINGNDVIGGNSKDGYKVKLWPGEHSVEGVYSVMGIVGCNVIHYETKSIRSKLDLEAGYNYTMELYLYNAKDREAYHPDDNSGTMVYEQEVDVVGQKLKAYLICYKVSKIEEQPIKKHS